MSKKTHVFSLAMNENKNEKKSRPSGLIFQENKTPLAAPPIPPPLLLFVVIPVSSLFFNNNELTGITTNNRNGGGIGGAAKGVLFSWKIRSCFCQ